MQDLEIKNATSKNETRFLISKSLRSRNLSKSCYSLGGETHRGETDTQMGWIQREDGHTGGMNKHYGTDTMVG